MTLSVPRPAPAELPRLRVGVVKLTSCDGCQLTLLDLEDQLLDIVERFDLVEFGEASSERSDGPYDVLLVEGSLSTPEQAARLPRLRAQARLLVAIGTCATTGGIQALRNWSPVDEVAARVYPSPELLELLPTVTPISESIEVDLKLPGCPIDPGQLVEVLTAVRLGRRPYLPDQSVCFACKRAGLVCVAVADSAVCLGPVTRAGCGAICPAMARGCYGCFGPRAGAAVGALADRYVARGESRTTMGRALTGFTAWAPPVRATLEERGWTPDLAAGDGVPAGTTPIPEWHVHTSELHVPTGAAARLVDGTTDRKLHVESVSRVEGEGSLSVIVRGGQVVEARLDIFEAPRFFERLVVGHTPDQVLDMVARICGICPVAYQMTAVHAFEALAGVEVHPQVRALRRLMYCGEWIQSHALHIYLLHAPDFLGYPSAVHLAKDHREIVERGLSIKRAGNRLLTLLGGRAIHPVSVKVGGFSRVPTRRQLRALVPALGEALADAVKTVRWASALPFPALEHAPLLLALRDPVEYPMNTGRIVSSDGLDLDARAWDSAFVEEQRDGSHALVARTPDGRHYLVGPTARVVLNGDRLHPMAARELHAAGGAELIHASIFRSIVARSVELVHALAEALEIIDGYQPPDRPFEATTPVPGTAAWSTEAPRGLLFHRYELDEAGVVRHATIVPPTSQNQSAIEDDLRAYLPSVLSLPDVQATERLESLIRSYDPCISCATHFLDLRVDRS